jgi:hypothetical protein
MLRIQPGAFFSSSRFASAQERILPDSEQFRNVLNHDGFLTPKPDSDDHFYVFSDAAAEVGFEGLGGWFGGYWWHFEVPEALRGVLHITALEFCALAMGLVHWAQELTGFQFTLCADAMATVRNLARRAARSPVMQAIFRLLMNMPEFRLLEPFLFVDHVYGPANIMADAASRAKFELIAALGTQLGIVVRRAELPRRALEFFSAACGAAKELYEAGVAFPPVGVDALDGEPSRRVVATASILGFRTPSETRQTRHSVFAASISSKARTTRRFVTGVPVLGEGFRAPSETHQIRHSEFAASTSSQTRKTRHLRTLLPVLGGARSVGAHAILGFRAPSETHQERHSVFAASISSPTRPRLRPAVVPVIEGFRAPSETHQIRHSGSRCFHLESDT